MNDSKQKTALPVAIAIITNPGLRGQVLLIKRVRGAYIGKYALPGGKIEINEHLSNAIIREVNEETGLKCTFKRYLGVVSELYYKDNDESGLETNEHFLLHICLLETSEKTTTMNQEGISEWFNLEDLVNNEELSREIVASDYLILKTIYGSSLNSDKISGNDSSTGFQFEHECVMRQKNSDSSEVIVEKFAPFG